MSIPSLRVLHEPSAWDRRLANPLPAAITPLEAPPTAHRTLATLFFTSDLAATVLAGAATAVAAQIWPSLTGTQPTLARLAFLPVAVAVAVVVLALRGAYSGAQRRLDHGVADDLLSLCAGVVTAGLVVLAAGTAGPLAGRVPPAAVLFFSVTSLVAVPASRALTLALVARDPSRVSRVIVVGSGRVAGELGRRLDRSPLVRVVGTVDDDPAGGHDVMGSVDELPALCRAAQADRVVIAFSRRHPSRSAELVLALRDVVQVDVVVRYFELAGWESRLHDVAGLSLLNLGGPPGRTAAAVKRAADVVVAAAALLVLSPFMAVIAAAIFAESGGPVLFRQARVGRQQRPFPILKFRTMATRRPPLAPVGRAPAEAAPSRPATAGAGSARTLFDKPDPALVTGVGRFLRRSGLDELPQLVNVLRGEMSLVGPRPFISEECARLSGWSLRRFDVRPGITGMWQVCGQHDVTFDELCRLDVQYATSWSLRTDLRILARTPRRLLQGSAPGR